MMFFEKGLHILKREECMKKAVGIIFLVYICVIVISSIVIAQDQNFRSFENVPYEYEIMNDGTVEITKYNGDESIVKIPDIIDNRTVSGIGDFAFSKSDISEVMIPENVIHLGKNPFFDCRMLSEIYVSPDNEALAQIDGVLFKNEDRSLVSCPYYFGMDTGLLAYATYEIPEGIEVIGEYAFADNTQLTGIDIPESVKTIKESAFKGCSGLQYIDLSYGVESIGEYAFSECENLLGVYLSGNLRIIGEYAFSNCSELSSIFIPEGVESIGKFAFRQCSRLETIELPKSLSYLGSNPFSGCDSLLTISLSDDNPVFRLADSVLFCKEDNRIITYLETIDCTEYAVPYGTEIIGEEAFWGCYKLEQVSIPDTIRRIEKGAFCGCSRIEEIMIPDSITIIEDHTFAYCESLRHIEISKSIKSIGDYAFIECGCLREVTLPSDIESIGDYAFYDCIKISNIIIPETVRRIGDYAFADCTELQNIDIMNGVTSFGDYVFSDCGIKEITIPDSLTEIGSNPFAYCDALQTINVSDGNPELYVIDDVLYSRSEKRLISCPIGLKYISFHIPDNVEIIGASAFCGCSRLEEVTIPYSVAMIEDKAFCNGGLSDVVIPESVVSLGESAFEGCSFVEITIPDSVTYIGEYAFSGCIYLEKIYVGRNSAAREYCIDNDLPYTYIDADDWLYE